MSDALELRHVRAPVEREILLALWKIHILHHAAEHPIHGYWTIEELAQHGYRVSPGTIYPILARMERNGWLRSTPTDRATAAKRYRITAAGHRLLRFLRSQVAELHEELGRGGRDE
jgi:DNA-binding PadR family transcriptional regulator